MTIIRNCFNGFWRKAVETALCYVTVRANASLKRDVNENAKKKNAAAFGNGVPDAGVTGRASKLAS